MRVSHLSVPVLVIGLGFLLTGCGASDATGPLSPTNAAAMKDPATMVQTFRAHLAGRNEVPALETRTQGEAVFHLSPDGTRLTYRLILANIHNVLMAHIHMAGPHANGPIVVWLYPSTPPAKEIPGRFSGVLATGTITAADFTGPLATMPMDSLVAAMRAGDTYVQVHTTAHPAGEVRGQISTDQGF